MQSRPRDGRTEWWRTRTPICHRADRHTVLYLHRIRGGPVPARQPQVGPHAPPGRCRAARLVTARQGAARRPAIRACARPSRRRARACAPTASAAPPRRPAPSSWLVSARYLTPSRPGAMPSRRGADLPRNISSARACALWNRCRCARGMTAQQPELPLCTPEGPAASSPRARRRGRSCSVPRAGTRRALFAEAGGPSSASSLPVDASARFVGCVARR
jgi:hypothetical protein